MAMFGGEWIPVATGNPLDDLLNTELIHEHLFFDDGSGDNVGFWWNGRFSISSIDNYKMDGKVYEDNLMRQAIKNVSDGTYSLLGKRMGEIVAKIAEFFGKRIDDKIIGDKGKNNCQDWADRVRKEYEKLYKSLPKSEQERIAKEMAEKEARQQEEQKKQQEGESSQKSSDAEVEDGNKEEQSYE